MGPSDEKESYYRDTVEAFDSEDAILEDPLTFWQQEKRSLWRKIMSRSETPFVIMGAGLLLLVVILFALAPKGDGGDIAGRFELLSERLDQTEKKLSDMEIRFERLTQVENKVALLNKSVLRFDSADASATLRMNRIANDLSAVQKDMTALINRKPAVSTPPATAPEAGKSSTNPQTVYHVVQSGETLYRISQQYQVRVDSIRRLNDLSEQVAIYPGQKLKIDISGN